MRSCVSEEVCENEPFVYGREVVHGDESLGMVLTQHLLTLESVL